MIYYPMYSIVYNKFQDTCLPLLTPAVKSSLLWGSSWICLHYIAGVLHSQYCTPWGVVGFLMSPIMSSTPYCSGLSWVIYHGSQSMTMMWIFAGGWFSTYLASASK